MMLDNSKKINILGVDTGGTFTDFVFYDGLALKVHKVLSTPQAPEKAILQGIKELDLVLESLLIVHGSTVATNAVLQNRGVRTVYVTNHGFADVLTIGRQARRELFNLQPEPSLLPVPTALCLEVDGRVNAAGDEIEPLSLSSLEALRDSIEKLKPQAVAINLLFSYLNNSHEQTIERFLKSHIANDLQPLFISRSSEVLPEYREYERGIATWLNACTGPLVQDYLNQLELAVQPALVTVMQSAGGTVGVRQAGKHAVQMLLSGPAGGLAGARFVAAKNNIDQIMTFDMGGTSSDVALIDKKAGLTTAGKIAQWPVAVPMVDMHTIGAGGGSIAKVDAGGLLQVGPESAGANPGPACYGNQSTQATVTDANLVLGRILPNAFLGGHLTLDVTAARQAVQLIATDLGVDLMNAAEGIIQVANEHMSAALRVISVQRGLDPQHFTLVSFGGAGGLHVCALAEALEMKRILVPLYGGVLSALGMLVAPHSRLLSITVNIIIDSSFDSEKLSKRYKRLVDQATKELQQEGLLVSDIQAELLVDMRYQGQSSSITLAWQQDLDILAKSFHDRHEMRFGHCLEELIEIVNIRVQLNGPALDLDFYDEKPVFLNDFPQSMELGSGLDQEMHIIKRSELVSGVVIDGPALIVEPVATTYVKEGWKGMCEATGNLMLRRH
ncbi:N-methylhydantoinase A [hydrothermal vent metagenome]|uniref:N-methylhydantoinase A n=1 Tax=hydrothermal vent metagenome TaxID=652676 RepID=A0A3B0YM68_9ZZZZ